MIIQVGPYPPPLGGISMYVKRIKQNLDLKNIDNIVLNVYSDNNYQYFNNNIKKVKLKKLFIYIMKNNEENTIFHYNITGFKGKLYVFLLNKICKFKGKKIITLHGDCNELFLKKKISMRKILNSFDIIICVKKGDKKCLIENGVRTSIYEIPAYINPVLNQNEYNSIPKNIKSFIENSKFLICANGAIRFHDGQDLYGLDILINFMKKIKFEFPNVKLLFCLLSKSFQNKKESEYYKKIKNDILKFELQSNILIYEVKDTEFAPILSKSKLFIRPTNTDGDAISIRESLYLNIPCIASDIVVRPKNVILFKNRDVDSLYEKFKSLKINYDKNIENLKKDVSKDNFNDILKLYNFLDKNELKDCEKNVKS